MRLLDIRGAQVQHPTGDPRFAVMQAFPSAFSAEESDPFLMCDHYGPTVSKGAVADPDEFPVGWHPHRGMDICSYIISGTGRHADSLGNRGTFPTPGVQWISVGSGIEHAEGGGTAAGEVLEGFQIWINVPAGRKMDDPSYGTSAEPLPLLSPSAGVGLRVVSGRPGGDGGAAGPFKTSTPVQMVDIALEGGASYTHVVDPEELDNCLVYIYKGDGVLQGEPIRMHEAARLDASDPTARGVRLEAGAAGLAAIVFAGKRLNEPVAWRGPIVMNTDVELQRAFHEYRSGVFLRKKADWDYRLWAAFPQE
ncbi:unnamed protein product, partial [Ectocarpus fasciculatus]